MIHGFHHVALQCADLAACERFYTQVLGLAVVKRWPADDGGVRSVWVALGDGFIALERASAPPERRPWTDGAPGLHLLALRIEASQRAEWESRLAAHGIAIEHRTGWTLYVRDPEGNRIGLSHHPQDAP